MKLFGSKVYQIAATLVRIEALFLAGLAIYLAVRTATSKVEELDAILAEIIFLSFASAGLFFAGRGFIAKRNFARAPTVLANLIAIGVAYYMIDGFPIVLFRRLSIPKYNLHFGWCSVYAQ